MLSIIQLKNVRKLRCGFQFHLFFSTVTQREFTCQLKLQAKQFLLPYLIGALKDFACSTIDFLKTNYIVCHVHHSTPDSDDQTQVKNENQFEPHIWVGGWARFSCRCTYYLMLCLSFRIVDSHNFSFTISYLFIVRKQSFTYCVRLICMPIKPLYNFHLN